jgi:hypothetical protein
MRLHPRVVLLAGAALAALTSSGAAARDLPATPEGAAKITAFLTKYAGASPPGAPPSFTVTPEAGDYVVGADLGALSAPLRDLGVSYDPAVVKYKVFEQDDGAWRVEQSEIPAITGHSKQKDVTVDTSILFGGFKSVFVIDPALSWLRSGQFSADKTTVRARAPGVDEAFDFAAQQGQMSTTGAADGAVSSVFHQDIKSANMTIAIDPKAARPDANPDAKPVNIAASADAAAVSLSLDGVKPRPLLDLWAFLAAHPTRAQLAAEEPAFKTLMSAALAAQTTAAEEFGAKTLSVHTPQGEFKFDGAKLALDVALAGPRSRFEQHLSVTNFALPPELLPQAYRDLVPTSFDLNVKLSGFDLTAAGEEAIADAHLAGEDPPISNEDGAKISARLIGQNPLVIDIGASHIKAPLLDATFEGQIRYLRSKPTGKIILHMRDFDKSIAALKVLGPEAERKMVPVAAMAKGLAKSEPDGTLTWVCEIGADSVMKVNGLPLGKAPF